MDTDQRADPSVRLPPHMKMRTPFLLVVAFLSGCSGPKHISPAEFKTEYTNAGLAHTVKSYEYLGQRDGRAYIKVGTMYPVIGWSEQVHFVELAKLEPELQDSLPETEYVEPK